MSRWSNKYVIGLTGNIATGKSVVRQMLQHSGAYTIDADSLGHQAMSPGAPAFKPIVQTFGKFIVGADGKINRQMLGQIVFSNPEALKKLEAITHPIIRQAVDALVKRSNKRVVVIEAIKLLEGDMKDWVDEIWVVNASRKTQFTRLVTKRKMSQDDAKQRILAQGSQDAKLKAATTVIQNDGDVEQTWKQVQSEWNRIKALLTGGGAKPAQPAASAGSSKPAQPVQKMSTAEVKATEAEMSAADKVIDVSGLSVKRAMPNNAQQIADFINAHGNRPEEVNRMDILMSIIEKSFLLANNDKGDSVALLGWTVENLVTRMDEFYVAPGVPVETAVHAIVVAVEDASKELNSEAAFLILPTSTDSQILAAFKADGYEQTTIKEIKIPLWREAVKEQLNEGEKVVHWKQLRKDRVTKPI